MAWGQRGRGGGGGLEQQRIESFHNFVAPGKGKAGYFPPEKDRYHLYISLACPFAHRTLMARNLKGLEEVVSLSVVHHFLGDRGWYFASNKVPGCIPDFVNNCETLRQVYELSDRNYRGKISVPVLFDKKSRRIVNNDSAEIVRIFNDSFNPWSTNPDLDLYPQELSAKIDEWNEIIGDGLNHAVYDAGFATTQRDYDKKVKLVHETLIKCENNLRDSKFMCGDKLTETDIRLFCTVVRFDPVYYVHFKCNSVALRDLPAMSKWMKKIFKMKAVRKYYYIMYTYIIY